MARIFAGAFAVSMFLCGVALPTAAGASAEGSRGLARAGFIGSALGPQGSRTRLSTDVASATAHGACRSCHLSGPRSVWGLPRSRVSPLRMVSRPDVDNEFKRKLSEQRRWKKSTKQIATLGPASCTEEMIEKLFLAGADVFRLNFSHGKHEEKAELIRIIRSLEDKYNHPVAVLADLQGPKLRVDVFDHDKVMLVEGQTFRFDLVDEPGDSSRVKLPHPEIIQTLQPGDVLLLDDGKLRVTVTGKGENYVDTVVEVGGVLSNRKGVNTPTVVLPISPLTPKDRKDLDFAVSIGVDWVALSFVQRAEDMKELKALIAGAKVKVMAKLEKPSAVHGAVLDQIIESSDGIMIARGDLGVEMLPEDVPVIQKRIIERCRQMGRPVVVATQMLESMISTPTPTRAEASDVATAIFDGADAIMLSAESAAGKYPVEAVMMQQRVINRVEQDPFYREKLARTPHDQDDSATDAVTNAAREIAGTIGAAAVVVFTERGTTVLRASMGRPPVPILAITPEIETARALALTWGVYPAAVEVEAKQESFPDVLRKICLVARDKGLVNQPEDMLVVTAGLPFGSPGVANVIRIVPASGPEAWAAGEAEKHGQGI